MKRLAAWPIVLTLLLAGPASAVRGGLPTRSPKTKVFVPPYDHQPSVRRWIRYLRGEGHLEFRRWTARMGHYAKLYQKIFTAHGLPPELAWLSGRESGFERNAVSYAGAAGLWQFLPRTARSMGLRVDRWVDERFDPEASTLAAARHLLMLYKMFKSWPLVLAAYHTGAGHVKMMMRRYKTRDYFKIARHGAFQKSTRIYVPKGLAFIAMASGPEEYKVRIRQQPDPLREDLVILPPGTHLRKVSKAAKLSYRQLRGRNRHLVRGRVPRKGKPVRVRLPFGTGWRVVAKVEGAKPARARDVMAPIQYTVKRGDSIWAISRRFGVKIREILVMNGIRNARLVRPGQELLLPPPGSKDGLPGWRTRKRKEANASIPGGKRLASGRQERQEQPTRF